MRQRSLGHRASITRAPGQEVTAICASHTSMHTHWAPVKPASRVLTFAALFALGAAFTAASEAFMLHAMGLKL